MLSGSAKISARRNRNRRTTSHLGQLVVRARKPAPDVFGLQPRSQLLDGYRLNFRQSNLIHNGAMLALCRPDELLDF